MLGTRFQPSGFCVTLGLGTFMRLEGAINVLRPKVSGESCLRGTLRREVRSSRQSSMPDAGSRHLPQGEKRVHVEDAVVAAQGEDAAVALDDAAHAARAKAVAGGVGLARDG